jgi:hypothetical protein
MELPGLAMPSDWPVSFEAIDGIKYQALRI